MNKFTFAAAVLAGLVGTASFAQTTDGAAPQGMGQGMGMGMGPMGGPMGPVSFADLDTDGNGSVTLEELQARPAARFAAADTNSDGALSADEIQAAMLKQMAENMIARMDANGDGLLQPDEMQPRGGMGMERMFDLADADNDGMVTQAEFDAIKAEMEAMRGQMGDGQGRGEGRGRGHGHGEGHGRGDGQGWSFFGLGGN